MDNLSTLGEARDSSVSRLREIAPEFMTKLEILKRDYARTGDKRAVELIGYGNTLKSVVEKFTGAIDFASNVGSSIMYGVTHPFGIDLSKYKRASGLNGLGFIQALLPLASIATASAAVTAIAYFITRADNIHADIMRDEWTLVKSKADRLKAQGKHAEAQAAIDEFNKVQKETAPKGFSGVLGSLAGTAIAVAVVYMIFVRSRK